MPFTKEEAITMIEKSITQEEAQIAANRRKATLDKWNTIVPPDMRLRWEEVEETERGFRYIGYIFEWAPILSALSDKPYFNLYNELTTRIVETIPKKLTQDKKRNIRVVLKSKEDVLRVLRSEPADEHSPTHYEPGLDESIWRQA